MNPHIRFNQYRLSHGFSYTKLYSVWGTMKQRCLNPKNPGYPNYGGRGITVCDRWMKFENFLEDMGERPPGMTLERIDNSKGYCKENCEWASYAKNLCNRRPY